MILWTFAKRLGGLCGALVSLFEVCLQLLHLLTHATIFFFFFTWHVALGHWRYWFKNNNMVAVWTPIYERIHKTFTYSNTFRLFFSGNPFHCQILLISLTLLSRWANTSQHQDSLSRRKTNIIMHPIRERVSGYKTETIKAYMSSFFFLSRHV